MKNTTNDFYLNESVHLGSDVKLQETFVTAFALFKLALRMNDHRYKHDFSVSPHHSLLSPDILHCL